MNGDLQQAWRALAERHLQMAELLTPQFPDGGFFHTYHAFECLACAWTLERSPGATIPDGHRDKIEGLMDLLGDSALADRVAALWTHLDRRSEALYPGWRRGAIRTPDQLFTARQVQRILRTLRGLSDLVPSA